MASAGTMVAKAEEIQDIVKRATGCEVTLAGYLPLYGRSIDYLVRDQVTSFSLAFVSVFLVVILILRSWRLTLAAIAPNLLPVGLILGVMGWSGIRLDMATVTIAAAVLGVIVDDTIHVLYRFRSALRSGLDIEDALRDVARTSGLAVVSTSLILCVGFGVLAACGVRSVSSVGSLIGLGVVSALLTDLILLPAIIAQIYSSAPERRNSRLTRRAGAEMALTA
jgi:predicted RND superfamily exporter protein